VSSLPWCLSCIVSLRSRFYLCRFTTFILWHSQVDELKKRSEDLKREALIRKRQEEEQKRRLADLQDRAVDFNEKFGSMEEEVQVRGRGEVRE
jgi:hypothetical protein